MLIPSAACVATALEILAMGPLSLVILASPLVAVAVTVVTPVIVVVFALVVRVVSWWVSWGVVFSRGAKPSSYVVERAYGDGVVGRFAVGAFECYACLTYSVVVCAVRDSGEEVL